jgi:hypothetical protein
MAPCFGLYWDAACPPEVWRIITSTSTLRSSTCPDKIFDRAASILNHSARSTSGKASNRPLLGGHSISNELLTSFAGSKSPAPAKATTRFPPRCQISPNGCSRPIEADGPSSSANSRQAACSGSSAASISPFGIDHAPASFLRQKARPDGRAAPGSPSLAGDRPGCQRSTWPSQATARPSAPHVIVGHRSTARAASAARAAPQFGGHKVANPVVEPAGQHHQPRVPTEPPFRDVQSLRHRLPLLDIPRPSHLR